MYRALGLDTRDFETNLVVKDGVVRTGLATFGVVMGALGWQWKLLQVAAWSPEFLADPIYRLIARYRYRWFGAYDTYMLPDSGTRVRFFAGWFLTLHLTLAIEKFYSRTIN